MSANIPFEIQAEIIQRVLLVKSLIRFRSVSRNWKSLIDSPEFITNHSVNQNHPPHLLVSYRVNFESKYVFVVDDDSSPRHMFSPDVPPAVNLAKHVWMLDCSHGLVCLYGYSAVHRKHQIVVWNLSIRKSVGIICYSGFAALGFGVCPKTFDPKIVKITSYTNRYWKWKAEVFTISSGCWRTIPLNIHMPQNKFAYWNNPDGIIYWVTIDSYTRFIVSFDLTSEEFGKIDLPENLAYENKSSFKLKKSLVVVIYDEFKNVLDVWKMIKNGDSNYSFEKVCTVNCLADDGCEIYDIIGFTKNGRPIREHRCEADDGSEVLKLEIYEPCTGGNSDLGIYASSESTFTITSYTESLLLLNHSESIILE